MCKCPRVTPSVNGVIAVTIFLLMAGAISFLSYNFIMKLAIDSTERPLESVHQTTLVIMGPVKSEESKRCDDNWNYIVLSDGHRF